MSIPADLLSAVGIKVELGGVQVLDIPSFFLREREVASIVGPNGSGKSTLLLTLACLLKPTAGRISYRGKVLNSREDVFLFRRKLSMVFQEPLLFDTTVYGNVASGLKIRGLPRHEIRERVMTYLKHFQCDHLAGRSARKLSGGESQRTSLARAFAVEPEILLLDEPFSALDPPTRHSLMHDLDGIVRKTGTTTIMVTHLESEALNMSSRIVVLNEGRMVQTGSPLAVMNNPSNEFVARFVGMDNILPGKVTRCAGEALTISIAGGAIVSACQGMPAEKVDCCIRPENVTVCRAERMNEEIGENAFTGKVSHVYSMGPFVKLSLDCGFPLVSLMTQEAFANLRIAEQEPVCASFKPSSVHLIRK